MSTNGILLFKVLVLIKSDDCITGCSRFYFLYFYSQQYNLFPNYFSNSLKTKESEKNELTDVLKSIPKKSN